MSPFEQEKILQDYHEKRMKILCEKGQDYNDTDLLGIFKLIAAIEKRTPEQVILSEITKKVLRLQNLMSTGKEPNFESISDNILDLSNYTDLLLCAVTKFSQHNQPEIK